MLPDMSGLELTRMLKRDNEHEDLAVIMLTARADEYDKVTGLEGGADDYVTKPFSPRELVARIQAVLRRSKSTGNEVVSAGVLVLDPAGHRVAADGNDVQLGPTEYRLLKFFMTHPDRVYAHSIAGSGVGCECLRRGTDRRRPRATPAQGTFGRGCGRVHPDSTWRRLSILRPPS